VRGAQGVATIDNRRTGAARYRVLCGYAGVAGPVVFTAAAVVAPFAQTSYSWRREDLSALAALGAQNAWITITGMVVLGICTMALAFGLRNETGQGEAATVGPIMLFVAGTAIVGAGLMRNDCSTELRACADRVRSGDLSWHHHGHDFASIVIFLVLLVVPLVFAEAFRSAAEWARLRFFCLVTAVLSLFFFVLYLLGPVTTHTWQGLLERLFVLLPFLWIAVLGTRLARRQQ
jgi:hypothetical membrane protein